MSFKLGGKLKLYAEAAGVKQRIMLLKPGVALCERVGGCHKQTSRWQVGGSAGDGCQEISWLQLLALLVKHAKVGLHFIQHHNGMGQNVLHQGLQVCDVHAT